jgi:hypothetical protein
MGNSSVGYFSDGGMAYQIELASLITPAWVSVSGLQMFARLLNGGAKGQPFVGQRIAEFFLGGRGRTVGVQRTLKLRKSITQYSSSMPMR